MNQRTRQYLGILAALVSYYVIHEGAHLLYACSVGAFERIRCMGFGIQIAADTQHMTDAQLETFCMLGSVATSITGYILVVTSPVICKAASKVWKACMYYITIAMLLIDPLYLSTLCGFVGGGDMNGIALLVPERMARATFGVLLMIHAVLFWKRLLPIYKSAFAR